MVELFKYCPRCGNESFGFRAENLLACGKCEFHLYRNAASAVAGLLLNEAGEVLLTIRAKEPAKGKYGLPGGFVDYRETGEEALKREIQEEVGLEVDEFSYLGSFPNKYDYKEVTYYTLDLFFFARVKDGQRIKHDPDELGGIEWKKLHDFDVELMAFESMRRAIRKLRTTIEREAP